MNYLQILVLAFGILALSTSKTTDAQRSQFACGFMSEIPSDKIEKMQVRLAKEEISSDITVALNDLTLGNFSNIQDPAFDLYQRWQKTAKIPYKIDRVIEDSSFHIGPKLKEIKAQYKTYIDSGDYYNAGKLLFHNLEILFKLKRMDRYILHYGI